MELQVHSFTNGDAAGSVALSADVFEKAYNEPLIHQVVTAHLAAGRRGTKAGKNRAAVRGGGTKPFRQKGLGRARAGTIRSPLWRGGGVTFAATPRSYAQKVNRKMYRQAMRSIFSELIRQDRIVVVASCDIAEPKTKALLSMLANFASTNVLIVTDELDENLYLASRNLHQVNVVDTVGIDPSLLLAYDKTIVTKAALARIETQLK